jgi:hypothetical protein
MFRMHWRELSLQDVLSYTYWVIAHTSIGKTNYVHIERRLNVDISIRKRKKDNKNDERE